MVSVAGRRFPAVQVYLPRPCEELNLAFLPDRPFKGCHTYGRTIDEALSRVKEVIELCMEDSQAENLRRKQKRPNLILTFYPKSS